MDSRTGRDGRPIEELGHYDPLVRNLESRAVLKTNRIRYWLSVGAQPSEKVQAILNRHGVKKPANGEPWALPEPPAPASGGHDPRAGGCGYTGTRACPRDARVVTGSE